jgi:branched-chain amino acid transport system ATP-binding protein
MTGPVGTESRSEDSATQRILSIHDLTAGYGRVPILRNVNLHVGPSEVLCVMGRNGVGKTTLLRVVMGVLRVRSGTVEFLGRDITSWKAHTRARAGMAWAPQEGGVFSGLSVEEHLYLACRGRDLEVAKDRVRELFPALSTRLRQEAQTLSGGERKMLGVAQAVLSDPRILVLDEPTEGVAPMVVDQMQDTIQLLANQYPIMLAEQNMDTALAIGHRAYVIEKGVVVEEGDIQALHEAGTLHERLAL